MINSSEGSDILVFNSYLCHVSFLLTCYVCSTKIGEISDISKCFENFVSQALGVLTRIYAAELRSSLNKHHFFVAFHTSPLVWVGGFYDYARTKNPRKSPYQWINPQNVTSIYKSTSQGIMLRN